MSKKMLIDASHEEETRVVIVDGTRVEDLDFESAAKRQLRGNVYLAKVTRVEPSLQAAFIEYGGNRHGFLAFPEIHPDYYQIPHEDRLALQEEEEAIAAEAAEADDVEEDENLDPDADDAADEQDAEVADEQVKVASTRRKRISKRRYKIQEVIKRGQILLVQAVKEERGNKGAAMTTYLSLAGRYCVLMPNTPRGGGISRKIASQTDRKRLKSIMNNLDVPTGVGVIVRTAGAKKTKVEIKRDYDYLMNLWDDIRETTMKSTAPALIHEEGNLVKRSLRDLYNKDISEVLIQGEQAYDTASGFMKLLMPSHAENVKHYTGDLPLFLEYGAEKQLEASLDATVQLKSGGYLVIHPTEALVSVDVNSGRSTKERNVERTALKTNLEAADEVARQMRMRDLAGLIVIDFIDMDENKNNRAVEKRMKEALARDRARVQYGKISQFGLMEISRQRRRRSLLEGSTAVCRHCDGVGRKRTVESSALKAIRALEELAARGKAKRVTLKVAEDVAHYINNEKRELLVEIEKEFGVFTEVLPGDDLIRPHFDLDITEKAKGRDRIADAEKQRKKEAEESRKAAAKAKQKARESDDDEDENDEAEAKSNRSEDDDDKPKRRRRGRRGGRGRRRSSEDSSDSMSEDDAPESKDDDKDEDDKPKRRRRRAPAKNKDAAKADDAPDVKDAKNEDGEDDKPKRRRRAPSKSKNDDAEDAKPTRRRRAPAKSNDEDDAPASTRRRKAPAKRVGAADAVEADEAETKPKRARRKAPAKADAAEAKPKRTRKAPAKAKADDDAEAKPTRRRRAPAKSAAKSKAAEGTPVEMAPDQVSVAKDEAKPARRRRAPAKAKAEAPMKKPAAKRKAPAKKADDAEAKPAAKRQAPTKKAPAKKAPAKTAAAKPAEKTEDKAPAPRKRAPAKAKAAEPDAKPAPRKRAATKAKAPAKAAKSTADDKPKKRGWWNRLTGE